MDEQAPPAPINVWSGSFPQGAVWERALTPEEIATLGTPHIDAFVRAILRIPGLVRFWSREDTPNGRGM